MKSKRGFKMSFHRSFGLMCLCLGTFWGCGGDSQDEPTEVASPNKPTKTITPETEATPSPIDAYKLETESLVAAIDAGTDAAELLEMADQLTRTGMGMLPAMMESHPACQEYLTAIQAVGTTLRDLSIEDIEVGYHADGKLPKMPSPECYHGKDLVVHPATVAALAKAGLAKPEDRERAKGELVEVLIHLGEVANASGH